MTKKQTSRRHFLKTATALGASGGALSATTGCAAVTQALFAANPPGYPPFGVRSFVQRQFAGLHRSRVWDSHLHVIGNGRGGSGCWVNPAYRAQFYKRFLYDLYLTSAGVADGPTVDTDYVARVLRLKQLANPKGKIVLLAFDMAVRPDGSVDKEASQFFVPNAWVQKIADEHPVAVRWGASVHPYRKDALERLDAVIDAGCVAVKWLPNAMAIDPALPRCDAFYRRLAECNIVLIVHAGEEQAADSAGAQGFGNVLRLRRALDHGVRVCVAHCAGLGKGDDLDQPEVNRPKVASWDLMKRLFQDPNYKSNLYADISAMTQFNRSGRPLREAIVHQEFHPRLVNGSDFPLPSLDFLISTRWLEKFGYLSARDRQLCNAVFEVNPLLYDFVVKRALRVHSPGGDVHRFSDQVFESARLFDFAAT